MKIYFAGAEPKQTRGLLLNDCGVKRILVSYFSFRKQDELKDEDVFLDSGAFTAWSQNKPIDIQKYITYIKQYKDKFRVYANLDVIGNPEETLKNQKIIDRKSVV